MIEITLAALIGGWIGGFVAGIATGFCKIADNPYPQYKTKPRDYTKCSVMFSFFFWPAMLSEYFMIKFFG